MLDLEPIKARLAAASIGPWGVTRNDHYTYLDWPGGELAALVHDKMRGAEQAHADADFIGHAPADVAALIDEVESLRGSLKRVRNINNNMGGPANRDADGSWVVLPHIEDQMMRIINAALAEKAAGLAAE